MPSSRGFGHPRVVRQRRLTEWDNGPGIDTLAESPVSISSTSQVIIGSGIAPAERLTVVRLHGVLELVVSTVTGATDGFTWAFGVGICSADAFAVGVTAVPGPFDDATWSGWVAHRMGALHGQTAAAPIEFGRTIEIDSKAMRKMGLNEVMFATLQVGEEGTSVMAVRFLSRVLSKLA